MEKPSDRTFKKSGQKYFQDEFQEICNPQCANEIRHPGDIVD